MEQNNIKALVIKKDADKLSTYLQAKFPQDLVSHNVAMDFARWCIAHQLEPIRDCIPYQGNPYILVDWLDRQASDDGKFKGYSYRVFSQKDKETLDFDPKDLVVECQADWEGLKKPLVGLGVVTIKEREAKTGGEIDEHKAKGYRSPVVHLKPQQMVFKRARAAALKQRYHIPAPILEELPYTTIIEPKYTIITEPSPDEKKPREKAGKSTEKVLIEGKTGAKVDEKLTEEKASEAEGKLDDETRILMEQALEKEEAANFQEAETSPTVAEASNAEPGSLISWLDDAIKDIGWDHQTVKTWLSRFNIDISGTLRDVLRRCTKEQIQQLTDEVQARQSKKPRRLL